MTESGAGWADVFEQQFVEGCMLGEVVFFHKSSGTIISSDLVENFTKCDHWPTRMYLKLTGIHQKPGLAAPLRLLYRDRKAARRSMDRIQSWDTKRIVLAHGENLLERPREVLRETYSFL